MRAHSSSPVGSDNETTRSLLAAIATADAEARAADAVADRWKDTPTVAGHYRSTAAHLRAVAEAYRVVGGAS